MLQFDEIIQIVVYRYFSLLSLIIYIYKPVFVFKDGVIFIAITSHSIERESFAELRAQDEEHTCGILGLILCHFLRGKILFIAYLVLRSNIDIYEYSFE